MFVRGFAVWIVLALGLLLNEAVREFVYRPVLSRLEAHAVSSLLGAALIVGVAYLFVQKYPQAAHRQWVWIGRMWLVLTLAFELVYGLYFAGMAWDQLLERYNLLRGWLGLLIPLSAWLAPGFWSRRLYPRVDARLWMRP